ncbi:MAG: TetR/AcrR family transcriptional regulator [Clostridia bacterium]|nr:TetR/AcrR family transcriptional regulator [Clostridia bacterium]
MPKQTYFNLPDEKKERIRRAVVNLFGNMPYDEVTTRLLVKESGISMGSLYQYFDSKDEMYVYFIDTIITELRNAGVSLKALAGNHPDYAAENKFFDSMFFAPSAVLEQYYFSKNTDSYRINSKLIESQKEAGKIPADVDAGLVQYLTGGLYLSMILYSRTLNNNTAYESRKFWDDNAPSIIYFTENLIEFYNNNKVTPV